MDFSKKMRLYESIINEIYKKTNFLSPFTSRENKNKEFTYKDLKTPNSLERLSSLLCKDAIISEEIKIDVRKTGVNIDPTKLPNLEDKDKILKFHPNMKF